MIGRVREESVANDLVTHIDSHLLQLHIGAQIQISLKGYCSWQCSIARALIIFYTHTGICLCTV